jgi:hypothetical protein
VQRRRHRRGHRRGCGPCDHRIDRAHGTFASQRDAALVAVGECIVTRGALFVAAEQATGRWLRGA